YPLAGNTGATAHLLWTLRARRLAALDQRPSARRAELAVCTALAVDREVRQVAELRVFQPVRAPAPPVRPADAAAGTAVRERRPLTTGEDHRSDRVRSAAGRLSAERLSVPSRLDLPGSGCSPCAMGEGGVGRPPPLRLGL